MTRARDIVVIGTALGGVTAVARIAMSWPSALPATVMIAMAAPEQPAPIVLQILQGYAPVPIAYAVDGETARPRQIYLSPPGKHLVVGAEGRLRLDSGNPFDSFKPSVNCLFSSAAAVYGARVIGIVLSGNSKDGAQGLRDIEAAGGVAIVQEPDDAIEPRMPRNAIANDHPTYCVKASEIAGLVQRLMRTGA